MIINELLQLLKEDPRDESNYEDPSDKVYAREKVIAALITKAFLKAGFEVVEEDFGGVEIDGIHYDVMYEDSDAEAVVTTEAVNSLTPFLAIKESGLFETDKIEIAGVKGGLLRFTFTLNKHLRSGTATIT